MDQARQRAFFWVVAGLAPVGAAVVVLQAFIAYDWEQGVIRAALLLALGSLLAVAAALGRRRARFETPRALAVGLGLAVAFAGFLHVRQTVFTIRGDVRSEMGEIHVRALPLLLKGVNPWAWGTVLDSGTYLGLSGFEVAHRCLGWSGAEAKDRLDGFWGSLELDQMRALFPATLDAPECAEARELLAMSGYKYGPVMLAAYAPFVLAFGRPGIYLCHLAALLAIVAALWRLLGRGWRPTMAVGWALAVLLGQSVILRNTLIDSDCDLIPTALGCWGLVFAMRDRPLTAGVLLGLSVGAKLFPGMLLLPLLLNRHWLRGGLGFGLAVLVGVGPAAVLDGRGLFTNVVGFNLWRGADSTSLAYFVPERFRAWLLAVAGLVAVMLWVGAWRQRSRARLLVATTGTLLVFLASAKVFHNNYLVWLIPIYGATLGLLLTAGPAPALALSARRLATPNRERGVASRPEVHDRADSP
jgi:hypothetical protein